MSNFSIAIVIRAIDRATQPLRQVNAAIGRIMAPVRAAHSAVSGFGRALGLPGVASALRGVASGMSDVVAKAGMLAAKLGLIGGVLGWGFKNQFVDVAAQFERFETILGTVEGSAEKARSSMTWISDFASTTPYELAEVTDAFVKLRAYGMDPMNGLLKALGDTSAAMGKPLMDAVEAIADAVTGEPERLKEFGIRASKVGERVVYEYTHAGKTIRKAVDAGNRELIQATLTAIWNQRYAGAMGNLSGTWSGMLSNLADQWTRFANMVMQAGVFDWLKDKAGGLLATIDRMAASGELQRWANEIGQTITRALQAVWDFLFGYERILKADGNGVERVAGLFEELRDVLAATREWLQPLADRFGAARLAIVAAGLALAGPLLAALAMTTASLVVLGTSLSGVLVPLGWLAVSGVRAAVSALVGMLPALGGVIAATWAWTAALLANPITWIVLGVVAAIAAVAALAAGIAWAVTHWDEFKAIVASVAEGLKKAFGNAVEWVVQLVTGRIGALMDWAGGILNDIKGLFGGSWGDWFKVSKPEFGIVQGRATGAGSVTTAQAAANRNQPGAAALKVTFDNAPPGTRVETERRRGMDVDLDLGYAMVAP